MRAAVVDENMVDNDNNEILQCNHQSPAEGRSRRSSALSLILSLRRRVNEVTSPLDKEKLVFEMKNMAIGLSVRGHNTCSEDFRTEFLGLCPEEQLAFLNLVDRSFRTCTPITSGQISGILFDYPSKPFYVDLSIDSSTKYQDGSKAFPFWSVDTAVRVINTDGSLSDDENAEDFDIVVSKCGKDCETRECRADGCNMKLCCVHGMGQAIFRPGMAEPVFDVESCMVCQSSFCLHHKSCEACDLCTSRHLASVQSLDCTISPYRVCNDCSDVFQGGPNSGLREELICCTPCSAELRTSGFRPVAASRPSS